MTYSRSLLRTYVMAFPPGFSLARYSTRNPDLHRNGSRARDLRLYIRMDIIQLRKWFASWAILGVFFGIFQEVLDTKLGISWSGYKEGSKLRISNRCIRLAQAWRKSALQGNLGPTAWCTWLDWRRPCMCSMRSRRRSGPLHSAMLKLHASGSGN